MKIGRGNRSTRPVINSIYASTHKIAKHIYQRFKDLINLKNKYKITNTTKFADNVSKLKLNPEHKLLTIDIKDLYVKIPISCTLNIAKKLLNKNCVDGHITRHIMSILKMTMNQNYFRYEGKFYKPTSGVTTGSHLSSNIAEIFLQDLEQSGLKHLLEGKRIVYYEIRR
jgi:hypothetical protein